RFIAKMDYLGKGTLHGCRFGPSAQRFGGRVHGFYSALFIGCNHCVRDARQYRGKPLLGSMESTADPTDGAGDYQEQYRFDREFGIDSQNVRRHEEVDFAKTADQQCQKTGFRSTID